MDFPLACRFFAPARPLGSRAEKAKKLRWFFGGFMVGGMKRGAMMQPYGNGKARYLPAPEAGYRPGRARVCRMGKGIPGQGGAWRGAG